MRRILVLCITTVAAACSTPDDDCTPVESDCMPQYEPTFDNIHSRTLTVSCATGGGACHAFEDASGGFALDDIEIAYDEMSARAGSDSCGLLMSRISSDDVGFQMPPGAPLSGGEQCAILKWVEAGSPR